MDLCEDLGCKLKTPYITLVITCGAWLNPVA